MKKPAVRALGIKQRQHAIGLSNQRRQKKALKFGVTFERYRRKGLVHSDPPETNALLESLQLKSWKLQFVLGSGYLEVILIVPRPYFKRFVTISAGKSRTSSIFNAKLILFFLDLCQLRFDYHQGLVLRTIGNNK